MTYIEFFDKTVIENVCACLTAVPERVILIGDKRRLLQEHAERYAEVFEARGCHVEFECRLVNKNDVRSIVAVLTEIVQREKECAIDLTGGEELYLLATGIVYERFPQYQLQMHRFNIRNNTIIDVDQDGKTIFEGHLPTLTVEENIRLYGGEVVYDDVRPEGTHRYDTSWQFFHTVDVLWHIASEYGYKWNTLLMMIANAEPLGQTDDPLKISVPMDRFNAALKSKKMHYFHAPYLLRELYMQGMLTFYQADDSVFTVQFRDSFVRRCLTKAGLILELKIYAAALRAKEPDGAPVYNDVQTGVFIDWVSRQTEGVETENEIDVIMMKGMVPVFVSCKNGNLDREELYKFNTVAERFGGKYARKILVAPILAAETPGTQSLRQRAGEMGIQVVDDVWTLDDAALERRARSFWNQNL